MPLSKAKALVRTHARVAEAGSGARFDKGDTMSTTTRLFLMTVFVLAACLGHRCDVGGDPAARAINDDPNPLVLCAPGCERPADTRLPADAPGE